LLFLTLRMHGEDPARAWGVRKHPARLESVVRIARPRTTRSRKHRGVEWLLCRRLKTGRRRRDRQAAWPSTVGQVAGASKSLKAARLGGRLERRARPDRSALVSGL